jgi:hypothetical protein
MNANWKEIDWELDRRSKLIEKLEQENIILREQLKENTGEEPDTEDCSHPDTCGFCRARATMAYKDRHEANEKIKKLKEDRLQLAKYVAYKCDLFTTAEYRDKYASSKAVITAQDLARKILDEEGE